MQMLHGLIKSRALDEIGLNCAEVDNVFWSNLDYANKTRSLGKHTFEVPAVWCSHIEVNA